MKRLLLLSIILSFRPVCYADPPVLGTDVPAPAFYLWADRWLGGSAAMNSIVITSNTSVCTPNAILTAYTKEGKMVSLDGVATSGGSEFLCDTPPKIAVQTLTGVTMAILARVTNYARQGDNGAILGVTLAGGGGQRFQIISNDGTNLKPVIGMRVNNTACSAAITRNGTKELFSTNPSTGITLNQTFFYIASVTSNEILAYMNNEADGSPAVSGINLNCPGNSSTSKIIIGQYEPGYDGQPGPAIDIRAAMIWDVALSSAQKQSVYRSIQNSGLIE